MPKKKTEIKYWTIAFHVDATGHICVIAPTEEAARKLAADDFMPTTENTELGDAYEIVNCE